MELVECTTCGDDIFVTKSKRTRTTSNTFFCSEECKLIHRNTRQCIQCGKDFVKESTHQRFCNDECSDIWRIENTKRPPRICRVCGKSFVPLWSDEVTCSDACYWEYDEKEKILSKFSCPNCGITVERFALSDLYCSNICEAEYLIKTGATKLWTCPWERGMVKMVGHDGHEEEWEADYGMGI